MLSEKNLKIQGQVAGGRERGLGTAQFLEEGVKNHEFVAKVNTISSKLNIRNCFQMHAHTHTDTHSQKIPHSLSSDLSEKN